MILREWRGRALSSSPAAYPDHFRGSVLPELQCVPGFLGATLGKRQVAGKVEFLVLTRWESFDAIKAFAGDEFGKAVVEPGAVAALVDFDATVQHYEIIDEAAAL